MQDMKPWESPIFDSFNVIEQSFILFIDRFDDDDDDLAFKNRRR